MKNATFIAKDGKQQKYYMGCYGIGLGRTLATIAEMNHDEKGIIWPEVVAPYKVHLISLVGGEEKSEKLYNKLIERGVEILWDDRDVSAGVKLQDADLIGIPYRLVVSKKTGDKVEWKKRNSQKTELLSVEEVCTRLKARQGV